MIVSVARFLCASSVKNACCSGLV